MYIHYEANPIGIKKLERLCSYMVLCFEIIELLLRSASLKVEQVAYLNFCLFVIFDTSLIGTAAAY
jgi:hypothetical protein